LRNAVALLDHKVGLGVVKQQHFNLTSVIRIDNTRAGVNEVLCGETRAGSNTSI